MTAMFSGPIGKKLRVAIVDDYDIIRERLKRAIDHEHDTETVGEARNGEEAIRVAHALQPGILSRPAQSPERDYGWRRALGCCGQ